MDIQERANSGNGGNAGRVAWLAVAAGLVAGIAAAPLETLEYLSLNIIGEPPINGRTWLEGVAETGGDAGMRALGAAGTVILVLGILLLSRIRYREVVRRETTPAEPIVFALAVSLFFAANVWIGYRWWDPAATLGMGPMFAHSMLVLLAFGLLPDVISRFFDTGRPAMSHEGGGLAQALPVLLVIAFGYGLLSTVWHCCSFFAPKMYFFFFITKFVQLWAVTSFFFRWAFPMISNRWGAAAAYAVVSICFGLTYPWHTPGFAVAFVIFGLVLCDVARRAGSYLAPLLLLYFSYIFHAALPWHGARATLYAILPASVAIMLALAAYYVKTLRASG